MEIIEKIAGEITISDMPGVTIKKWREEFGISQMEKIYVHRKAKYKKNKKTCKDSYNYTRFN